MKFFSINFSGNYSRKLLLEFTPGFSPRIIQGMFPWNEGIDSSQRRRRFISGLHDVFPDKICEESAGRGKGIKRGEGELCPVDRAREVIAGYPLKFYLNAGGFQTFYDCFGICAYTLKSLNMREGFFISQKEKSFAGFGRNWLFIEPFEEAHIPERT